MEFIYDLDTRIDVGSGFRLNKALPVDLKTVVDTVAHRDLLLNHPTAGCIAYEGLQVFITGPDAEHSESVGKTFRLNAIDKQEKEGEPGKYIYSGTWDIMPDKTYVDSQIAEGGGVVLKANRAAFPETGNSAKIYIALDTLKPYVWSNSEYKELNAKKADEATKLSTARSFSISGDVLTGASGAVSFDGTDDVNLAVSLGSGVVSNINVSTQAAIAQSKIAGTGTGKTLVDDLGNKVDKETGKGLSTNDYTTAEKTKLAGIAEGAQVNVLEGVQVNGTDLEISSKKVNVTVAEGSTNGTVAVNGADVAVHGLAGAAYAAIANNVSTTTEGSVLDATQGKVLADRIESLEARGRYLSTWDASTGLPGTNPPESAFVSNKYMYKAGDYFVVSAVSTASPAVNYQPDGTYCSIDKSTTPPTYTYPKKSESKNVGIGDFYLYDGTTWTLVENTQKQITISQVTGLQDALDSKVVNTRKVNDKALSADITLNGADVALTGYSKPATKPASTAVAATDTINAAFGKVEWQVADVASDLSTHTSNSDIHVTAQNKEDWNAKYDKPADGIPKSDLDIGVKETLNLADSSVQSIATGSTNGTISVTGNGSTTSVAVKGLDTAAYKKVGDFDAAGAAASAETAAKNYTDTAIADMQVKSNIVTAWNDTTSDEKYPSEKLVKASLDGKVNTESGKGLSTNDYTTTEKNKLSGITEGANKVEASDSNGKIKIDGTETTVYTHPSDQTAYAEGFYKITTNTEGHVTAATTVAKTDITSVVGAVGTTENDLGLMTAADKTKLNGISTEANKVTVPATPDGTIAIDGTSKTVYSHPTTTAVAAGFKKVGNDALGHVVLGDAIAKTDITSVVGAVGTTENDLGLMTAADKVKLNGIAEGAQVNVIESLKVNGVDATISSKAASVTIPAATTTASGVMSAEDKVALNSAVADQHTHSNKALLDTYTQTETDLADAVSKKHSHANSAELDLIASGDKSKWDTAAATATKLDGTVSTTGSVKAQIKASADAILGEADYAQTVKSAYTLASGKIAATDITTGSEDGTIAVSGTNVAVKGLGSAAYTSSTAYATAAQGALADSAVQSVTTPTPTTAEEIAAAKGKIEVDGANVAVYGLAGAAYAAIANNVTTTTEGSVLDATQGKALADRISALEGIGRFLSTWNMSTGKPSDDPAEVPYTYRTGDYYIVSVIPSTGDKLKPSGTSYTGAASTAKETGTVALGDFYFYTASGWQLVHYDAREITFTQITGDARSNTSIAGYLDGKVDNTIKINGNALTADVTITGKNAKVTSDYAKASSASAIAADDPIETALGKLEYKIDNATTGTVTSVGLSMPSIFSVSGSPVTSSGTLTASLATQNKNIVFAGPASGDTAAAPTFRALVADDIPSLTASKISNFESTVKGIKVDAATAADAAGKVDNALTIKTSDSTSDTYDGSAVKTIDLSVYLKSADQVVKSVDTTGILALSAAGQLSADVSGKMDKDADSVTGNVAKFDASHNAVDTGFAADDVLLEGDTFIFQCTIPSES